MSKLLLAFTLAFTPAVLPTTVVQAANVPTSQSLSSGSSSMQLVARRYTARRSTSNSRTPNYLLLKSDPRRYNGPNYFVHPPYLNK